MSLFVSDRVLYVSMYVAAIVFYIHFSASSLFLEFVVVGGVLAVCFSLVRNVLYTITLSSE